MQPPFSCDYVTNIELGDRVFFNFNCVVLDIRRARIGDYTLFGPGVQILTPVHPMMHGRRIWVESEVGKGSTFFFTIPFRVEAGKTA